MAYHSGIPASQHFEKSFQLFAVILFLLAKQGHKKTNHLGLSKHLIHRTYHQLQLKMSGMSKWIEKF